MLNLFQYRHWAIHELIFADVAPRVGEMLLAGKSLDLIFPRQSQEQLQLRLQGLLAFTIEGEPTIIAAIARDPASGLPTIAQAGKNIALIPIIGGLTKYMGFCGEPGMQDYQSMILKANASPNVDGIVLIMDSPGGTVDGTQELALTVASSPKPIGVFGDQMVASAALWIATQADVIVGNKNNPTEFGSIGTLMVSQNWQNMIEAGMKPKMEIIRAPQSTDKALYNPIESMPEGTRNEINAELKSITDTFIGAVRAGRGEVLNGKLPGLFNGRMFDSNTAKQNGLIDSVGTLQTAVNKVAELAKQQSKTGTNSTNNKSAKTMKFPKLSALLAGILSTGGKEANVKVSSDGVTSEDHASLESAEQKLAEMEAGNARLTADNTAKDQKIAELSASVTSLQTEKATLTTDNATLKTKVGELETKVAAAPQGTKTTVIAKDDESKVEGSEKYQTSVDADAKKIREQNANLNTFK